MDFGISANIYLYNPNKKEFEEIEYRITSVYFHIEDVESISFIPQEDWVDKNDPETKVRFKSGDSFAVTIPYEVIKEIKERWDNRIKYLEFSGSAN